MRKLSETDLYILAVVAKHRSICIGVPVDEQWAPIAKGLERLSRPNPGLLFREDFDDGPSYSVSPAGHDMLQI
jgi:hypothetical protein